MMKKLLFTLSLLFPVVASAQGLHKDIDVEQSVTPSKREAARIGVLPTVRLTPLANPSLTYSSKVVTSVVPASFSVLDPVAWGDKIYTSPYRGYFDLGLGYPLAMGDISAGYRVMDSDRTRLGVWVQYNGDVYKRTSVTWHDHTATLGSTLRQKIGSKSSLDAALGYTYGFHDMPGEFGRFSESASRFDASTLFSSSYTGLDYQGGLRFQHFGFGNPHYSKNALAEAVEAGFDPVPSIDPVSQNIIGIDLGAAVDMGETSRLSLGVKGDIVATSRNWMATLPFQDMNGGNYKSPNASRTTALFAINPAYTFHTGAATVKVGAMLDVSANDGNTLKVAPDVSLAWHGLQFIGAEVKVYGGSSLNTLSSLYDITPYMNPIFAYYRSHTPVAIDAKISFGPFLGGTVELFGGYAKANDWLMPVGDDYFVPGLTWEQVNVAGHRLGVRLGYDNGETFAFSASWQHAPGDWKKAWFNDRDRARNVVNATAKLRPVKPLTIEASYELRSGRSIYYYSDEQGEMLGMAVWPLCKRSLGTVSDLSAGTSYTVNDALTFFARAENILSRKALLLGDRPVKGFSILAGVSLKF